MQFAIENRPGAGGIASAMAGKTAAPDGYTLLQVGNSYTVSASLFASLPYDLVKDFTPISTLAQFDILLMNGQRICKRTRVTTSTLRPTGRCRRSRKPDGQALRSDPHMAQSHFPARKNWTAGGSPRDLP